MTLRNLFRRCQSTAPHSFYGNRWVEQYAEQETRKVTLGQLMAFGRFMNQWKLLKSANYVKHELAVRIGTSRPRHIARITHDFMDFFCVKRIVFGTFNIYPSLWAQIHGWKRFTICTAMHSTRSDSGLKSRISGKTLNSARCV